MFSPNLQPLKKVLPMRATKVGLAMTAPAKRDQVQRIVVGLVVVNVMHCEIRRAMRQDFRANLAGISVPFPNLCSEPPVELSRPRPGGFAVRVSGVALALPFERRGFALFFRPELAHLAACFGRVFSAAQMWFWHSLHRATHFRSVLVGALVGAANSKESLVARFASLVLSLDREPAIHASPNFSGSVHVEGAALFGTEDVPVKLRRATGNSRAASGTGFTNRHRTTLRSLTKVYHRPGGKTCFWA